MLFEYGPWVMSRSKIVAVDFDGTVCKHQWPEIDEPLPGAIETLRKLKAAGWILIIWTCREGKYLDAAIRWSQAHGIEWDGVNETPEKYEFRDEPIRRKAYADVYIDDRNFGGFPGWDIIASTLLGS